MKLANSVFTASASLFAKFCLLRGAGETPLLEMDRDKRHLDLGTVQHDGVSRIAAKAELQ